MLPITVIIPIYNHEGYIEQCLRSVGASVEQPAEIILVDNGSSDRSVPVAASLSLPNLTIIENRENVGATRARHVGSHRATTPFVTFLDSDDMLGPEALALAYRTLIEADANVSLFRTMRISQDGKTVSPFIEVPERLMSGSRAFELSLGAWKVHAYGLFEMSTYRQAMQNFQCHGFSDDEVLARHLFLAAERVCASDGLHYYRDVTKPYTLAKVVNQTITNLRVLKLASKHRSQLSSDKPLREMRNVVARNFGGLLGRLMRDGGDRAEISALFEDYAKIKVPWHLSDAKYLAIHRASAAAFKILPS